MCRAITSSDLLSTRLSSRSDGIDVLPDARGARTKLVFSTATRPRVRELSAEGYASA